MSRVTINTSSVSKINENNIFVNKNSNIPVPAKRKAEEDVKKDAKTRKRAAFGDLTNAEGEKHSSGSNIKNQVKKGENNIVGKSKNNLEGRDAKAGATKKGLPSKVKEEVEIKFPELGTSSSSEEGTVSQSGLIG